MLDSYLIREDVKKLIKEIRTSDRYFRKMSSLVVHDLYTSYEEALYIFYDALFKYKIIINDIYLFPEYLEQIEKLYRKLDNYDDIRFGINKLICRLLIVKLDIKNPETKDNRDTIIKYIYKKYIVDGYFIHGFSNTYIEKIEKDGFTPEIYENYYDRFNDVNKVFAKNNVVNMIPKKFSEKKVFFTDDIVLGCYYSMYSPLYFSKFLMNEEYYGKIRQRDSYLKDRYSLVISPLKRFMSNNLFNEKDRKVILDLVKDEWDLLHREDRRISLLLVKRSVISDNNTKIDEFLSDTNDIYEVVDRLLNPKYNNISYSDSISKNDIKILTLDLFYEKKDDDKDNSEDIDKLNEEVGTEFLNKYGSVSYLLLLGSLFITLGVIFTIFKVIGG